MEKPKKSEIQSRLAKKRLFASSLYGPVLLGSLGPLVGIITHQTYLLGYAGQVGPHVKVPTFTPDFRFPTFRTGLHPEAKNLKF
jgi:hypothetical protein